ncbi:MAG: hypothetical protein Q8P67_09155 [archaeon]|nr:hypothetical protein [archaeon]
MAPKSPRSQSQPTPPETPQCRPPRRHPAHQSSPRPPSPDSPGWAARRCDTPHTKSQPDARSAAISLPCSPKARRPAEGTGPVA